MENISDNKAVVGESGIADSQRAAVDDALDTAAATKPSALVWTGAQTLYLLAGAAAIGFIFWWLQFSTGSICCGDFDGYYHIRWSQMLWEGIRTGHFPPSFNALPLTTLNPKDYVDHHFLFHILQIPFTWFHDPVMGAKIATMLFASLAVFSCFWLVVRYRLRYPLVWLIALLASSAPFLFRMNMAKAMSLSIVMLVTGILLLFERRYVWLIPLAFVFALSYDMFVLLCVAAAVWSAVIWWSEGRIEWRPVLWAGLGSVAGFIINPYFPHNIQLFVQHLAMKVTSKGFSTSVGGEWYPYDSWEFLGNCLVAFVAMVAGYIAFNSEDRKRSKHALFFLIFTTILLVANAKWKRFSEYWPPFAVLFAAFSLQLVFERVRERAGTGLRGRLPADVLEELEPFLDKSEPPPAPAAAKSEQARMREWVAVGAVVVLLSAQLFVNVSVTSKDIASSAPPEHYRKAMEWARANIPEGEIVFNTDWDDFPRLFYFSPGHAYVSGLDPTYLRDQNLELHKLYERITLGQEKDAARIIRERFNSRYVFTDKEEVHDDFYNSAMDSGWFEEVYDDDHSTVLRVLDEWRQPPPAEDDTRMEGAAPGEQEGTGAEEEGADEEEAGEPTPQP